MKIFEKSFLTGTLVWYLAESCRTGKCMKLEPNYTGPCVIICKFNPFENTNEHVGCHKRGAAQLADEI